MSACCSENHSEGRQRARVMCETASMCCIKVALAILVQMHELCWDSMSDLE
jgi:hypothetical protein